MFKENSRSSHASSYFRFSESARRITQPDSAKNLRRLDWYSSKDDRGSGSVTIDLDLNGFNGSNSLVARPVTLQFAVGSNSFFPILVFNDLFRGPEPGSMNLIPAGVDAAGYNNLPALLGASLKQLVVEKLPSDRGYDLAVRDGNTGFTFFNVEGDQYNYDAKSQSFSITNGRLLISKEFANALGRPSDTGAIVGKLSVGAAMQPIEITRFDANGNVKSATLPAMHQPGVGTVPGPDVIVGDLIDFIQYETGEVNGRVGLALGTDACNKGTVDVDWFALPSNDHPFIPQNLYRMSGARLTPSGSSKSVSPGASTHSQRHRQTTATLGATE